jgi:hypothetical protein
MGNAEPYRTERCPTCGQPIPATQMRSHLSAHLQRHEVAFITDDEAVVRRFLRRVYLGVDASTPAPESAPRPATLAERVAADVEALTADLGPAPAESGRPVADLSSYEAALREAIRTCPHEDVDSTLFGREWQCQDCGAYLDRAAMRRLRSRNPFGWLFG